MAKSEKSKIGAVLVVGGGIAGIQSSLDLANSGFKVYLLEEKPSIGGVMAQLDKTFPTNDCSMCILSPKLVEAGRHQNIELITYSEFKEISGKAGNFKIKLLKKPRFIDSEKCTGCGVCTNNCPVRYIPYFREKKHIPRIELEHHDSEIVNKIIYRHKEKRGSVLPILQDINAEYGYLPKNILKYLAQNLNQPLSALYNIATFYDAFSLTQTGKHTISVCLGTTCYVRGSGKIINALEKELEISPGETTKDRQFSLKTVRCLGCCSLAPVMKIDEDIHAVVKLNKIKKIVRGYE